MLELLVILALMQRLSGLTRTYQRSNWFLLLLPLFWFSFQWTGTALAMLTFFQGPDNQPSAYGVGIVAGIVGAVLVFLLVRYLPKKPLFCPTCEALIEAPGPIGAECTACGEWLRITHGKVFVIGTPSKFEP